MVLESRHQFIYGKNGLDRERFLRQLSDENPIIMDDNVPCAIYMDCYNLPQLKQSKSIDIMTLRILKECLNFSIACNILRKLISDVPLEMLRSREKDFLSRMNRVYSTNFVSLEELLNILESTRDFYMEYYVQYSQKGEYYKSIVDFPICFLDIGFFVRNIKELLNNKSYFALIFDQQEHIPVVYKRIINNFISGRINSDISIKVACEPEEWECYFDINGTVVESVHDYGEFDLDGSLKKYVRRLKDKYNVDSND